MIHVNTHIIVTTVAEFDMLINLFSWLQVDKLNILNAAIF